MKILVLGAAGMIGRKLTNELMAKGLPGAEISEIFLHDIVMPPAQSGTMLTHCMQGDLAATGEAQKLAELNCDLIFHLASIVSGDAENNFELGWDSNVRAAWVLFDALKQQRGVHSDYRPKVIFSSSIAVFGGPYHRPIDDEFLCAPKSSYGSQKAVIELMLADYCRKGYMDGMSIRLPTICVRPGKPNLAASSFYSGIIREPLNGEEAILPVDGSTRHWFASPEAAVGFLMHAASMETHLLEGRRSLNMPGVSCTVDEQIEALCEVAGSDVAKLIKRVPDERIRKIVSEWPQEFSVERATALGFVAEKDFTAIVRNYIDRELH